MDKLKDKNLNETQTQTRRNFLKSSAITLTALLSASCSDSKSNKTVINSTINSEDIWNIMSSVGAGNTANFITRDTIYSLPSIEYITNQFSQNLKGFFFSLNSQGWKEQENDCDDFALGACFLMNFLHHNTVDKIRNTGIAFGEFYYIREQGGGHAINVAIVKDNLEVKVVFYEPQTYSIVTLTQKEIESCVFWRF